MANDLEQNEDDGNWQDAPATVAARASATNRFVHDVRTHLIQCGSTELGMLGQFVTRPDGSTSLRVALEEHHAKFRLELRGVSTWWCHLACSPTGGHVPHLEKTKLCTRWQVGHCGRGAACWYAHGEAELRAKCAVVQEKHCAQTVLAYDDDATTKAARSIVSGSKQQRILLSQMFSQLYAMCPGAKASIKAAGGPIPWCVAVGLCFDPGPPGTSGSESVGLRPRPASEPPTLPKNKQSWEELSGAEQRAATAIGYSQNSWDAGGDGCQTAWCDLADQQRRAATVLGYTPTTWDAELGLDDGHADSDPTFAECAAAGSGWAARLLQAVDESAGPQHQGAAAAHAAAAAPASASDGDASSVASVGRLPLTVRVAAIKRELGLEPSLSLRATVAAACALLGVDTVASTGAAPLHAKIDAIEELIG